MKTSFKISQIIAGSSFLLVFALLAAHAQGEPRFEVAAIKPLPDGTKGGLWVFPSQGGRIQIRFASLRDLVGLAFNVIPDQVTGGPSWSSSKLFEIEAIADTVPGSTAEFARDNPKRIEALLKERFHLEAHREDRAERRYVLVLARKDARLGSRLRPADANSCEKIDISQATVPDVRQGLPSWCGAAFGYNGRFHGSKMSLAAFAKQLSGIVRTLVVDETGLSGEYDFDYDYDPAAQRASLAATAAPEGTTLFNALEEQLGLRLEYRAGPVGIIVIDHADPPDGN
jgi:uncharacterized protein (TIGR03435 family)